MDSALAYWIGVYYGYSYPVFLRLAIGRRISLSQGGIPPQSKREVKDEISRGGCF
jgi:hypothetical protein